MDQFANVFHCANQEKSCNNTITQKKISPHLKCVVTLPCEISVS